MMIKTYRCILITMLALSVAVPFSKSAAAMMAPVEEEKKVEPTVPENQIEKATKETNQPKMERDNISPRPVDMKDANISWTTEELGGIGGTEGAVAAAGFELPQLTYPDRAQVRLMKPYKPGTYSTAVIVMEGQVSVTPYEQTGEQEARQVILLPGQSTRQKSVVGPGNNY